LDLLGKAERLRCKAWERLGKAESEGDLRGSIVALREARECLETQRTFLSGAGCANLADVCDDAILAEAELRGLKVPINVRVVYDRDVIRNPPKLSDDPRPTRQ
jgi:hypothetical protein